MLTPVSLLIAKQYNKGDECSYYNIDPIQIVFKYCLCNGEAEERMRNGRDK